MKVLNQDLKNQTFRKVYLLYGNEAYLKNQYRERLKKAILGEDTMNLMVVNGKDAVLSELRSFTDTMPFFAEKRLVLLNDTGLLKASSEGFSEWLSELPDTACVVFTESEVDKRNKVYKKISDTGYAAELNHPDEQMMKAWILNMLKGRNLGITVDAYNQLLLCLPEDMEGMKNEIEKVMSYCEGKEAVAKEDVMAVCHVQLENRIFDLVSAVSGRRRTQALDLYYDLLALKEPAMRILILMSREFNRLFLCRNLMEERKGQNEVAGVLGVKPFIASKLIDQARRYTKAELVEAVKTAVELENAIKSGDMDENIAAELFIIQMTEKRSMA